MKEERMKKKMRKGRKVLEEAFILYNIYNIHNIYNKFSHLTCLGGSISGD